MQTVVTMDQIGPLQVPVAIEVAYFRRLCPFLHPSRKCLLDTQHQVCNHLHLCLIYNLHQLLVLSCVSRCTCLSVCQCVRPHCLTPIYNHNDTAGVFISAHDKRNLTTTLHVCNAIDAN